MYMYIHIHLLRARSLLKIATVCNLEVSYQSSFDDQFLASLYLLILFRGIAVSQIDSAESQGKVPKSVHRKCFVQKRRDLV